MKKGRTTSEFWMTIAVHAAMIAMMIFEQIDAQWAAGAMAFAQAVYTYGRSQVKTSAPAESK